MTNFKMWFFLQICDRFWLLGLVLTARSSSHCWKLGNPPTDSIGCITAIPLFWYQPQVLTCKEFQALPHSQMLNPSGLQDCCLSVVFMTGTTQRHFPGLEMSHLGANTPCKRLFPQQVLHQNETKQKSRWCVTLLKKSFDFKLATKRKKFHLVVAHTAL